jgi:Asp-tRNA(Asn)/Glu-tRNA(Gln) amidotransferase A subunit family amidase
MTTAWSYAGLPCITVPAGRAKSGLPLGVQAIARRGQDEALLAAACGLESGLRI